MYRTLLAAALAVFAIATPATAAAPTFVVGASAIVLPTKPSLASKPTNVRGVKRVAAGIYCVTPSASVRWREYTPLVTPFPPLSKKRGGTLLASWVARGDRCPAAAIEVRTFRGVGNVIRPASDVAFHVLVGGND